MSSFGLVRSSQAILARFLSPPDRPVMNALPIPTRRHRQTDRQTDRHAYTQHTQTHRRTDRPVMNALPIPTRRHRQTDRQTDRHVYTQHTQTHRRTDRPVMNALPIPTRRHRQTDRQTGYPGDNGNKGRPQNIVHGSIESAIPENPLEGANISGLSVIQAEL